MQETIYKIVAKAKNRRIHVCLLEEDSEISIGLTVKRLVDFKTRSIYTSA